MREFKVGDRVKIKSWDKMVKEFGECHYGIDITPNFAKEMKHLCGRTATISKFDKKYPTRLELESWSDSTGDLFWAFDVKMLEHVRDTNFKVGDTVRIRSWEDMKEEFGVEDFNREEMISCRKAFIKDMEPLCGEITTIEKINDYSVKLSFNFEATKYKNTNWMFSTDMIEKIEEEPKIVTYCKGKEVISELKLNDKIIKTAKARCCPTDTFDFNIGAKLSLDRLLEDKIEVKEVKRKAKIGEYIKFVDIFYTFNNIGDILKIDSIDDDGCPCVKGLNHLRDTGDDDYNWNYRDEKVYVVLENYVPPIKPKSNKGRDLIGRKIEAGTRFKVINVEPHVEINGIKEKDDDGGVLLPDAYKNMTGEFNNSFVFDEYKFVGKPIFDKDYLTGIDKENGLLLRWDEVEILD